MFQKCCYHSASCRQVFVDTSPSSIQTTGCCNNLFVTKVFTGTFLVFVTIYISGYTLFPIASWAIGLCDWALRDCCHIVAVHLFLIYIGFNLIAPWAIRLSLCFFKFKSKFGDFDMETYGVWHDFWPFEELFFGASHWLQLSATWFKQTKTHVPQ